MKRSENQDENWNSQPKYINKIITKAIVSLFIFRIVKYFYK